MAYDVGSIEAHLDLNRTPFQRGLAAARAEGAAFERNEIDVPVDVDSRPAVVGFGQVDKAADGSRHRVGLLAASIIALGPTTLVAAGVAAGALAPLTAGFVGLGVVALPILKDIHAAAVKGGKEGAEALARLGPGAAPAVAAFKEMHGAWMGFRQALSPEVFTLLQSVFDLVKATLPAFTPLIQRTARATTELVRGLTPLAPVFGRAFTAMLPIIQQVTRGILGMAQGLARWTQGQGFQEFIAYVQRVGPQLVHTLGALGRMFIQLGIAAAPLLPPFLQLVRIIADLLTVILRIPGIGTAIVAFTGLGVAALKVAQAANFLSARWAVLIGRFPAVGRAAVALRTVMVAAFTAVGRAAMLLFANPIGLAVAGVVAATVLIIKNWDKVKAVLTDIWNGLVDGAKKILGVLGDVIGEPFLEALDFIKGLGPKFLKAGENIIKELLKGMKNLAMAPVNLAKDIVGKVTDILPFSEPKDPSSPLRGLGKSGEAIMKNLAAGIVKGQGRFAGVFARAVAPPRFAHAHAFSGPGGIVGSTVINRPMGGSKDTYNINVNAPGGRSVDPRSTALILADEVRQRPPGRK